MRLPSLFAIYIVSTAAAFFTPYALHSVEMSRRRAIPVNSEAPLEPAPEQHPAPTGAFSALPVCESPNGDDYYKDSTFSEGGDIEYRHTVIPDISVDFCAVALNRTLYLVGSSRDGSTSEAQNWLRAYTPTGVLKWTIPREAYCSPPAVGRDGTVYLISMPRSGNTALTAYGPDGTAQWSLQLGGFEWNPVPPAIGPDGTIYIYSGVQSAPAIIAVTTQGELRWSASVTAPASQLAIAGDGTVIVVVLSGHMFAFDPQGHQLWTFYSGERAIGQSGIAIAADGTTYFAAGFLFALDKNGKPKWTFKSELTYIRGDYFDVAPAVAEDGTVYVDSLYHRLYAITPDGHKKWAVSNTLPSLPGMELTRTGFLRTQWAWFAVPTGLASHGWPSANQDAGNRRAQEAP